MAQAVDRLLRPVAHALHRGLGLSPNQVSWAAFGASLAAAGGFAAGHAGMGLGAMALGQLLDGLDGAIARQFGLVSPAGRRLDTLLDRASETAIFAGVAAGQLAPLKLVALAWIAIMLLTSIAERAGLDPGAKRVVLYFAPWIGYPAAFGVIFAVNLGAFIAGLLLLDLRLQQRMDALGGDLHTAASRALALPAADASSRADAAH